MLPRIKSPPHADKTPPIEEQAKRGGFSAGIFDFGPLLKDGVAYFNTSLAEPDGQLWLIARRSRNHPRLRVGINDIIRIKFDSMSPRFAEPVAIPRQFMDEHFEDPRAITVGDTVWISVCNFLWSQGAQRWTGAHQMMAAFDRDWRCRGRYDIPYGKNGDSVGANTGHEKNFIWFFRNGNPHLVYWASPHTVVEFAPGFGSHKVYATDSQIKWAWGEIRGGTPPVLVGNEYWTFFHSSLPVNLHRTTRRYVMGAYAFSANPPFPITKITRAPILQGSYNNRMSTDKPAVVFPCGALINQGEWIITGGSNDLDTFWCKITHERLMMEMIKLPHYSCCEAGPRPQPVSTVSPVR